MDGFQGAVLQVKLKYIDGWNEARRAVAARYRELFVQAGLAEGGPYPTNGVVLPQEVPGAHHVWHQYVIRANKRTELREFLALRMVATEIYYPLPLHMQKALQGLGYRQGDFPEAERAARETIALPMFPELREDEQRAVVSAIAEFLS
jgi:dTDP-4-amino-4,6-dideoxygalactose transaminase